MTFVRADFLNVLHDRKLFFLRTFMQSFDYISEKLGVSPTLDPFLGMCRTLCADLRIYR